MSSGGSDMTSNPKTRYPSDRVYVLRLHQDAVPAERRILGRLEHVQSGHQFSFSTADELIACLASGAAYNDALTGR